jgi:hypothetical protein
VLDDILPSSHFVAFVVEIVAFSIVLLYALAIRASGFRHIVYFVAQFD